MLFSRLYPFPMEIGLFLRQKNLYVSKVLKRKYFWEPEFRRKVMAEQTQSMNGTAVRLISDVLREVEQAVQQGQAAVSIGNPSIKDLRWQFDQVSAKMNQAIYNDEYGKIHETCLQTVSVLIEMLARS